MVGRNVGSSNSLRSFRPHKMQKTAEAVLHFVAGPGIAPGLEDYEPSVRLYTTPHVVKELRE